MTIQEIVISLIANVTRNFMYNRHADLYLGMNRVTILVSAKQLSQYLRRNLG
jgi:hypothetical protein